MGAFNRFLAAVFCACAFAETALGLATAGNVNGADRVDSHSVAINGISTEVTFTQQILSNGSKFAPKATGLLNVLEIPQSSHVTLKALNGGDRNWTRATVGSSVLAYNAAHNDSAVLAAVNGDPWIVNLSDYDGDGVAATGPSVKHMTVSRGLLLTEGEIINTPLYADENNLAHLDCVERGGDYSGSPVFAVQADGSYLIGKPLVSTQVENVTAGISHEAGGINRLPAPNSLTVYNHRCGSESMAYEDAYEIYLRCESTAFSFAEPVTGTVVAVFESGATQRPVIDGHTVVLSARGEAIPLLEGRYVAGDRVRISCSVTADLLDQGQRSAWRTVREGIGGFFTLLENGTETGQPGNATTYPCSVAGLKEDGTAVLMSTTALADGNRAACRMEDLPALCKAVGMHTAMLLDGGGSTTMVTLEDGAYVRRTSTADGADSVRKVRNGLAVVYEGVSLSADNGERGRVALLPDLFNREMPAADPAAAVSAFPTHEYRYIAILDNINGSVYPDMLAKRDTEYSVAWTEIQKQLAIQPAVLDQPVTAEGGTVALWGWAMVNGGQGNYYWSVDRYNWYPCYGEIFTAEEAVIDASVSAGNLTLPHGERGRFFRIDGRSFRLRGGRIDGVFFR